MAPPPWVLLHRRVNFIEIEGGSAGGAGKAAAAIGEWSGDAWSFELTPEEVAAALKPDPVVVDPPDVASLSMVQHLPKHPMQLMNSGTVSSTDKGLVVLYAGAYQPGNGWGTPRSVGYLVYDASSSSLSAIPELDPPTSPASRLPSIKCLGGTCAAVLRCRYGVHILAELVTSFHPGAGLPNAHLYLWRSSIPTTGPTAAGGQWASLSSARQWVPARQWVQTEVCLPLPTELCGPTCFFHIDMAFAFQGSALCWVDLLTGVLICHLFASSGDGDEPSKFSFSFVPLPQECCSYKREEVRLAVRTHEFRSMGCVRGSAIKFMAMVVGYGEEGVPREEVLLKTWTLSPDFKEWKEGPAGVLVRDLWESDSFREMELPRGQPEMHYRYQSRSCSLSEPSMCCLEIRKSTTDLIVVGPTVIKYGKMLYFCM